MITLLLLPWRHRERVNDHEQRSHDRKRNAFTETRCHDDVKAGGNLPPATKLLFFEVIMDAMAISVEPGQPAPIGALWIAYRRRGDGRPGSTAPPPSWWLFLADHLRAYAAGADAND
jgi:hypothetical protein